MCVSLLNCSPCYAPCDHPVSDACRLDADNSTCHLNVLLMYELYHDNIMASLLPINGLRNAALLAVTTPLAAMVDVDLLVSASLAQEMADSKM